MIINKIKLNLYLVIALSTLCNSCKDNKVPHNKTLDAITEKKTNKVNPISSNSKTEEQEENLQKNTYKAQCKEKYSTGKETSNKEYNWSLTAKDISDIIKLSSEIDAEEIHDTYPITPCYIDVTNYNMNGKKVNISINGGSFMYIYDGKKTKVLGCDDPKCEKYFLMPKENHEEEKVNNEY